MRTGVVLEEQLRAKRELNREVAGERPALEVRAIELEANSTPLVIEKRIGEENSRFFIGFWEKKHRAVVKLVEAIRASHDGKGKKLDKEIEEGGSGRQWPDSLKFDVGPKMSPKLSIPNVGLTTDFKAQFNLYIKKRPNSLFMFGPT